MRALKKFAIALTPFILNAELVKVPEIQEPSILLNAKYPKPVLVQETPLILNIESPPVVQQAPVVTDSPAPAAPVVQQAPVVTNSPTPAAPVVQQAPVVTDSPAPAAPVVQQAPVVTNSPTPAAPVVQQAPAVTNSQTSVEAPTVQQMPVSANNNQCDSPFQVTHIDVRHAESKGVGYQEGYTTLEGFGIYDYNPYFMPFLDLRGHVFNDGKLAGNIGIGERTIIPSINHIFGLYLYYDVRQEDHGLTVNQFSPGVEILGQRMEYRLNAYFPVGNDESHSYRHKFDRFQRNQIILKQRKKFAMTGADAEVGAHITQTTRHDFYFGIGPYYFKADPSSAWGGKTRLYWRYKDYVSLEASYSYDHVFKNTVQGTVAFSYPFGKKLERKGRNCPNSNDLVLSRAAFAPYRFEIPVVETRKETKAAINSATGQPWRVWFVNNTSSSNGTYESPFPTLIQAQHASAPNDMIYVFSGDETTKGMNTGITLKNGQTLFGSGTTHALRTQQGKIKIPASTARAPSLTNAGNIITLANGNEVSGLNLLVTQANSVAIDGNSGINGANINYNTVSGNVDHTGVSIIGAGSLLVNNNQFRAPTTANIIPRAIFIQNLEQTSLDIEVRDNIASGYFRGIEVTPLLNPTSSSGSVLISGNVVSNFNQFGIAYTTGMRDSLIRLIRNTVINNNGTPASISLAVILNDLPNAGTIFIDDNTILGIAPVNDAGILTQINTSNGSSTRISMNNNNVLTSSAVGSKGIVIGDSSGDVMCVSLTNNIVQLQASTGTIGLDVIAGGSGIINIDSFNNVIPNMTTSGGVNFVAPGSCP